jgi:hypothetical protein
LCDTVARTGLFDVYDAVLTKLKSELRQVEGSAVCLMFDGWTDLHKKYPCMGLRMAYVNRQWVFRVVTVSCKVLEKHTAESVSSHIRQELGIVGIDLAKVQLFTAHDGAPNMAKTSHFQHCIAHSLHLLLMIDGINNITELSDLIERSKQAVSKLVFKCYLVDDERAAKKNREAMQVLCDKLENTDMVLHADSSIGLRIDRVESVDSNSDVEINASQLNFRDHNRQHQTLKQPCITRWNSVLTMIESVLSLWPEMMEALKRNKR